jgi:hypothetical protein
MMYAQRSGFIVAFMQSGILKIHLLTGQCTVNEYGFALNAGNAAAIMG